VHENHFGASSPDKLKNIFHLSYGLALISLSATAAALDGDDLFFGFSYLFLYFLLLDENQ